MNKYEQALVSAVKQITEIDAAKAASDARWLNGMLRDLAPQVIGQREYKMLTALLNCEGNRILAEAAKKSAAARDADVERLVQRLQSDFLLDEASARRICALYLAGVTGDDAFVTADDRRKAKPEPTPAPKPKPAPTPAPTPKPAPQKAADDGRGQRSAGESKKWIIAALLAVILAVAAWQVIANRDTAVDDPARDKRMVEAWVKVNDRVLADVKSTEFDYLNCTGPEDLKADLANRSEIYNAVGVDMTRNFTLNKDETKYRGADGEVHTEEVRLCSAKGDAEVDVDFTDYLDMENFSDRSHKITMYTGYRGLTAKGAKLLSPYLPKYAVDICSMNRKEMLKYFGITEEMLEWISDSDVDQREALKQYKPDGYTADLPSVTLSDDTNNKKYGDLIFSELYEKDDGELVDIFVSIDFDKDGFERSYTHYEFQLYPMPDAVTREIPTQEKLREYGAYDVYTDDDLRMAKAWIAARDNVISGTKLSGIDLMKPTGIEDIGMYLDGDDGLYFYDYDGNDYTDSYSKNVLCNHDFGDDQYFLIYGHDDSGYGAVGRILYSPQGSETLSQYYGNGSLTFYVEPGDSMKNTANLSTIMPDMLRRMVGSNRETLLRGLGISQEMLDWLNKNSHELGILHELFGRSVPAYCDYSKAGHIEFSRFVEGTDGGTVNVSVTIYLPDEGEGFSKTQIEYTYY